MKLNNLLTIGIAIALGAVGATILSNGGVKINDNSQALEEKQKEVDYWKYRFEQKSISYDVLNIVVEDREKEVTKLNDSINKILQKKDEDIINVDNLSDSELQKFFTNRYSS